VVSTRLHAAVTCVWRRNRRGGGLGLGLHGIVGVIFRGRLILDRGDGVHFRRRGRRAGFGFLQMFEPLVLGGEVITGGVIVHGAVVVAIGGAKGAGEVFDAVQQIGGGIAQAFGGAGVTKASRA
jgi:hypothetical protein